MKVSWKGRRKQDGDGFTKLLLKIKNCERIWPTTGNLSPQWPHADVGTSEQKALDGTGGRRKR